MVCNALRACGDPFADNDQRDAFTVFNFACHTLGGRSLQSLLGEKPKPPPKPRKARAGKAGALALPGVTAARRVMREGTRHHHDR